MNFILAAPSLEHRALVTIVIKLWNRGNVRHKMPKTYNQLKNKWHALDDIVAKKISQLVLPPLLKRKMLDISEQVGLKILSWVKFHVYYSKFFTDVPDTLVWTPHGTIDKKKTAEVLVKDETIDVKNRFLLACTYCLEDEIFDLRGTYELSRNRIYNYAEASFWSDCLKEDLTLFVHEHYRLYEDIFRFSALGTGNVMATKYFSDKVRPEIDEMFKTAIAKEVAILVFLESYYSCEEQRGDVLFFLLSEMNMEQKAEIFQSNTYEVLTTLLVWPRQSLFLEMANDKWNFLSKECYERLLHNIVHMMSCKRSYMKDLFCEYWQQTPQTYKQFVADSDDVGRLLLKLYQKDNEKMIIVILKDSSISKRKNLIFSDVGCDICNYLVYNEKWDSVKYLIQECISSPQEMREFKDQIIKNTPVLSSRNKFAKKHQWNNFLQMIDNFIITYIKKKEYGKQQCII